MSTMQEIRNRMPNIEQVRAIYAKRLLGTEFGRNVVAVGIGNKIVQSAPGFRLDTPIETDTPAVRVYVDRKLEPDQIASSLALPQDFLQVPIDVIPVGQDFRGRPGFGEPKYRSGPGSSIGPAINQSEHPNVNPVIAGTLGAVVEGGGKRYVLSCNHVLAANGRIPGNTEIKSPAPIDDPRGGGSIIADLSHHVPLVRGENRVDCALALLTKKDVSAKFPDGSDVTKHRPPALGDRVVKFGKATGPTEGRIVDIDATLMVEFSFGSFKFTNQILIESNSSDPFATDGDSGALVVSSDDYNALGLLFAPAGRFAVACPIGKVFAELEGVIGVDPGTLQLAGAGALTT